MFEIAEFKIARFDCTILSPIGKRGEMGISVRDSELFEIAEFEIARFDCIYILTESSEEQLKQ